MYAQLGDIRFEALKGFDAFMDNQSTNYAEHAVIDGKPKLQRVGSNLQELNLTVSFNINFCSPEEEYAALNEYREAGEILPLVYGNGGYEGDFVIVAVNKRLAQTTANGDCVHMTCDITLLEYFDRDKLATMKDRAIRAAFATSENRPLPANSVPQSASPAAQTMQNLADAKKSSNQLAADTAEMKKPVDRINPIIDKAQKFRDKSQIYQSKLVASVNKVSDKLNKVQDILNVYTSLQTVAPGLAPAVVAAKQTADAARNVIQSYVSLPGVINTVVEATFALDVMNNTVSSSNALTQAMKDLDAVSAPIANYLAQRK